MNRQKGKNKKIKNMQTYRELIVWQKAMSLVLKLYTETKSWPKEEVYGLTSQIRRCAVSVPSNIAEGYGRNNTGDYIRFFKSLPDHCMSSKLNLKLVFNSII